MSQELNDTRDYLERHHGGNGVQAAERTVTTHGRNHDSDFMAFWHAHLPATGALHIADLGCGPALFLQQLAQQHPDYRLSGVEIASYMLERMKALPANVDIRIADLNAPGEQLFAPHSLDACLANQLIHELHQPLMLFRAIRQWLKPDGVLILTDMVRQPLRPWLEHKFPTTRFASDDLSAATMHDSFRDYFEHNRYTPEDLCDLLALCGLEVVEQVSLRSGRAVRIAARPAILTTPDAPNPL